ncbi:MAG: B12-binding domain-containing protein [Solirubrobacteraceae bacterium]
MENRWRIKEFAARTGVSEATLRAWERRYGLLDPSRSDGGYRLYSPADERCVLAMNAHMSRGVAAAEAAKAALGEVEAEPTGDVPSDPEELVAGLLEAVTAYDATSVDRLLEAAFTLGRPTAISEVLMPVMHEIGERWASGTMTVAHEHFASHLVERRLMRQAGEWGGGDGPLALLACPSGERHTLALLSFGVALAEHGWRIAYLGADMPIEHVADAAARLQPDAVVLSATKCERLIDNTAQIGALCADHRTLVAGPGATVDVARRLKVDRLPLDPVTAAASL